MDAKSSIDISYEPETVGLANSSGVFVCMFYALDLHQTPVHLAKDAAPVKAASPPAKAAAPVNNNYSYGVSYPYYSSKKKVLSLKDLQLKYNGLNAVKHIMQCCNIFITQTVWNNNLTIWWHDHLRIHAARDPNATERAPLHSGPLALRPTNTSFITYCCC